MDKLNQSELFKEILKSEIVPQCVKCGYCCTRAVCTFGGWNEQTHQCDFLTKDSRCAKYKEIKASPNAEMSPAFGAGCSSTLFNERRDKTINQLSKSGKLQLQDWQKKLFEKKEETP